MGPNIISIITRSFDSDGHVPPAYPSKYFPSTVHPYHPSMNKSLKQTSRHRETPTYKNVYRPEAKEVVGGAAILLQHYQLTDKNSRDIIKTFTGQKTKRPLAAQG
jgi:hypothetical protein